MNVRFLALMLRQIAAVTRDEEALAQTGLTAKDALPEIDKIIWEGISL